MKASEAFTLECHSFRETDNAILLTLEDGSEAWVPFSQIEHMVRDAQGGGISVTMTKWIAQKKGFC